MKTPVILLLFCSQLAFAQLELPELSPRARIVEEIGYTRFEVLYGRPSARERKIFGDLVPYNRLWRTGAGKSTWLIVDTDVFINNKQVPAGAYAVVAIPGEKEWIVMFNSDTSKIYGDPREYDGKTEVARVIVKPETTDHYYNSLTMYLDAKKYDAEFYLAWENTQIHFLIETRSHQKSIAAIESALKKDPNDVDALGGAAYYYSMNNESLDQIVGWLDRALSIKEDRWHYRMKIEALEKMKNYGEARKTASRLISYVQRDKENNPEWQDTVREYEGKLKTWPK
jgi:tetratricopeptide (TPR) repeat protein